MAATNKKPGLFDKISSQARSAFDQASTIVQQQTERLQQNQHPSNEPYSPNTQGRFGVSDLRQAAAKYDPRQSTHTAKLQMAIKAGKEVVLDYEHVARNEQIYAKQLYTWTQEESHSSTTDVKDVGDRLAWIEFRKGELEADYSKALEQARTALKDVRNFENKLSQNRDKRNELKQRMQKLQDQKADTAKIEALHHELMTAEGNDEAYEASIRALKRKKLQEAFTLEFTATKEFGEKLSVLAGYGQALLAGLDDYEDGRVYSGFSKSEQIKKEADQALNTYRRQTPLIALPQIAASSAPSELSRTSTVDSFGYTHAHHLASIDNSQSSAPGAGRQTAPALPEKSPVVASPALNPATLNQAPVSSLSGSSPAHNSPPTSLLPVGEKTGIVPPPAAHSGDPFADPTTTHAAPIPHAEPTVAETGVPLSGTNGPAEGQIQPRRPSEFSAPTGGFAGSSSSATPIGSTAPPSKEEEYRKEVEDNLRRLTAEQQAAVPPSSASAVAGTDQLPAYSERGLR